MKKMIFKSWADLQNWMRRRPKKDCLIADKQRQFNIEKAKLLEQQASKLNIAKLEYRQDVKKITQEYNTDMAKLRDKFGIEA